MVDLIKQFMRHSAVGMVAFIVDFLLMVALKELLGLDPLLASTISFVVSVIVSYEGSMRWVFVARDDISRRRQFVVYMVLSAIGLLLNSACMLLGQQILQFQGIDWSDDFWYMVIKVLATFAVTFYNFFSRRRWLDASNPRFSE